MRPACIWNRTSLRCWRMRHGRRCRRDPRDLLLKALADVLDAMRDGAAVAPAPAVVVRQAAQAHVQRGTGPQSLHPT